MGPHVYVIRVCGVSFHIEGPTKELLFQWPPNCQIGPSIKPYHVEGSLRQLGYRPRGISFSGGRIWALDMDAVREKRAAQAKGADPEDLAAAGVMLMGRRADHD